MDPHKSGYIPYPAGALCYRNSAMRDLVTFSAPVVFHGDAEPTVGIYGIEGSKPGAAPAAVPEPPRHPPVARAATARSSARRCSAAELLYVRLLTMYDDGDQFRVIPVSRLPAEVEGGNVADQLKFLRERIDRHSYDQILGDSEARDLLGDLGPDLNIIAYAFNFRTPTGDWNTDLALLNRFNRGIYDILSIDPGHDIYDYNLIVSTTDIAAEDYGETFVNDFTRRLGVSTTPALRTVTVLRSVVMDPWIEDPRGGGSFLDVLEQEYKQAVSAALNAVTPVTTRGY